MTDQHPKAWEEEIPQEPPEITVTDAASANSPDPAPEPEPPTYPEPTDTYTLAEARGKVSQFVDEFARDALKPKRSTDFNPPLVIAINAPPGIGKTHAMMQRVVDLLKAGKKVIILVPTHMLGEQLARDLEKNLSARVYRSRDAADPIAVEIGVKMCRQMDRIKSIRGALGDEEKHACKSGKEECKFYDRCGFQRQKRNPPQLWIVAHQMLHRKLPDFICKDGDPDVVIIDEAFHDAGNDKDLKLHLSWLIENRRDKVAFPAGFEADQNQRLIDISMRTHQALMPLAVEGRDCRIDKQMLAGYLTLEGAQEAVEFEWKRKRRLEREYPEEKLGRVYPGQDEDEAKTNADAREDHNRRVEALATFWEKARDLLVSDLETSLHLYFEPYLFIDKFKAPGIRIMRRSKLHEWVTRCPVLHLDATMNPVVVKQLFPHAVFREVNVKFPPTETVFIKQVTDRIGGKTAFVGKRVDEVRDEVNLLAGFYRDARVAVICPDGLEKELRKSAPKNVAFAHYHHLRGRNDLEKADVTVLIGRDEPPPEIVEAKTRLLFEREVTPLPDPPPGQTRYYPRVTRYLRLRDGQTVPVINHRHPDEGVEAYRWLSVEAELIQAAYRPRPLNRSSWQPLILFILTSICLPLPVDSAMQWKDAVSSLFQRMFREKGMATDSPTHAFRMFPGWFTSVKAAEHRLQREPYREPRLIKEFLQFVPAEWQEGESRLHTRMTPQNPVYRNLQDSGGSSTIPVRLVEAALFEEEWPGVKAIRYREVGSKANRPATLYYLPHMHPDPLASFSTALGCDVVPFTEEKKSHAGQR